MRTEVSRQAATGAWLMPVLGRNIHSMGNTMRGLLPHKCCRRAAARVPTQHPPGVGAQRLHRRRQLALLPVEVVLQAAAVGAPPVPAGTRQQRLLRREVGWVVPAEGVPAKSRTGASSREGGGWWFHLRDGGSFCPQALGAAPTAPRHAPPCCRPDAVRQDPAAPPAHRHRLWSSLASRLRRREHWVTAQREGAGKRPSTWPSRPSSKLCSDIPPLVPQHLRWLMAVCQH